MPELKLNEDQLAKIAAFWTTHKDIEFSSDDVVAMLELVKIAEKTA